MINSRFTIKHTSYEETAGMIKGKSQTRSLIKVYDNKVLIEEFTRLDVEVWICICVGGVASDGSEALSLDCKKSEQATKSTSAWKERKNKNRQCFIINSKQN